MSQARQITPQSLNAVLEKLVGTLAACHPKAVLLFGSAAAFLQDPLANPAPGDLDILLGPSYNNFGIEQIDVGARIDTRDYSRHIVLYGQGWWQGLTLWARRRRNLFERLADKLVMADRFC